MPTINDPYDLVENLFGFTPEKETLSLAEKKTPLGIMFTELQKVRDKLGLKRWIRKFEQLL